MNATVATEQISSQKAEHIILGRFQKRLPILALLLFALTLVVYNPASHFEFLNYDDPQYITENSHVQLGLHWHTVRWAFTTFEFFNWHPLTWISYLADYQFFGLKPDGYHFENVVYHATAAVLLLLVLYRGTGQLGRSFAVAILFAVHPLNVESVAWVAERKNVLSAVFWFLAIWAYGWYALRPSWKRYCIVALCFALGLMAKPMVITLPCVLLLLDIWPLCRLKSFPCPPERKPALAFSFTPRNWWELVLEKVPLFLLSTISAVLTFLAQIRNGGMATAASFPIGIRVENAVVSYARYIGKTFLPWKLSIFYPYPYHTVRFWQLALATLLLAAVTVAVVSARNPRPYFLVGWLWFLGTLVPVIGLFQNGDQAMADRYAYTPLIGFFVMLVWGAAEWLERSRARRVGGAVLATVLLGALIAGLRHQLQYWHDSVSLFSHAVSVTQQNTIAEMNLGEALARIHKENEAAPHFLNAVRYSPDDGTQHYNYGRSLFLAGKPREAIAEFNRALQLGAPKLTVAKTYHNMAAAYLTLGKRKEAKLYYELATRLYAEGYRSYMMVGLLQFEDGEFAPAQRNLEQSNRLMPTDVAYLALGHIYEQQGRLQDAKTAFEKASQISPDYIDIQHSLEEVQKKLQFQKNSIEAAVPAVS